MKVLSIVGARPQFVKAAMIATAFGEYNRCADGGATHVLVHTGQHYDPKLSDIFFSQLPLPKPDHHLGVGSASHGKQTAALLAGAEQILLQERPTWVVVYGDTNSTLAGALAAAKLHIPVAHVEAGLRSFNRRMPEEINRVATDHMSEQLLCPTKTAVDNLRREGITDGVCLSGDVMLDAVLSFRTLSQRHSRVLSEVGLQPNGYILVTIHRAENTDSDERMAEILSLLARVRRPAVFPMHPRTRKRLAESAALREMANALFTRDTLRVIEPVSYLDMLVLEGNARLVLTDSGGVQKEAYFLGVRCLTLRSETEWIETLQGGWNRLIDAAAANTLPLIESLWSGNGERTVGQPNLAAFGNGHAAHRIVNIMMQPMHRKETVPA